MCVSCAAGGRRSGLPAVPQAHAGPDEPARPAGESAGPAPGARRVPPGPIRICWEGKMDFAVLKIDGRPGWPGRGAAPRAARLWPPCARPMAMLESPGPPARPWRPARACARPPPPSGVCDRVLQLQLMEPVPGGGGGGARRRRARGGPAAAMACWSPPWCAGAAAHAVARPAAQSCQRRRRWSSRLRPPPVAGQGGHGGGCCCARLLCRVAHAALSRI